MGLGLGQDPGTGGTIGYEGVSCMCTTAEGRRGGLGLRGSHVFSVLFSVFCFLDFSLRRPLSSFRSPSVYPPRKGSAVLLLRSEDVGFAVGEFRGEQGVYPYLPRGSGLEIG